MRLQPKTPAGEAFLAACMRAAPDIEANAAAADHEGVVAEGSFDALAREGVLAAFVPEALGGLGLESIADWTIGIARLAEADPSVAIASNMHLGATRGMAMTYAANGGAESALRAVVAGHVRICATATERGTDNLHPLTEAEPSGENYVINGHKMFVTMSPVATHLAMNLRLREEGRDDIVSTMLPIDTPGVVQNDDWDALGMRASGSQSIRFENVTVSKQALRPVGPWGQWSVASLVNRATGNLPLVGASLGIAEAAAASAIDHVKKARKLDEPVAGLAGVQTLVSEVMLEVALCRSAIEHATRIADECQVAFSQASPTLEQAHAYMVNYQTAKSLVNPAAIRCVNKAMDAVGGASFSARHPLARLYRDVRSAPFMQPGAPAEARHYLGRVALGDLPER